MKKTIIAGRCSIFLSLELSDGSTGGDGKSQNRVGFLGNRVKIVEKNVQIGDKSENRNLRWGIPDSADRSVLKS